jgi:hypothetical protein
MPASDPISFELHLSKPAVLLGTFAVVDFDGELSVDRLSPEFACDTATADATCFWLGTTRLPDSMVVAIRGLLLVAGLDQETAAGYQNTKDATLLHAMFVPLRLYVEAEASLDFVGADQSVCHFELVAPSNINDESISSAQQYRKPLSLHWTAADMFALFRKLDVWSVARVNYRFFSELFNTLYLCVDLHVSRERAVEATLSRCRSLLAGTSPQDFALGIDCLSFLPAANGQKDQLSMECSREGLLIAGDCYCNSWTWGRACEFDWDDKTVRS